MTTDAIVEVLARTELFEAAERGALRELAETARSRKFRGDEAIFHRSDSGATLYVIVSGGLRIESLSARGETVHHAIRGPGETVGELSLLDDEPRMADARTVGETEMVMIDKSHFMATLERHPNVALSLLRCLARRLRQAARTQVQRQELDVSGRLSRVLLELARSSAEPGVITALPSQQDLASRVGCTRESVSRALAALEKSGAIGRSGREVRILDPRRLKSLGKA